jgi:hypothetical protein
MSLWLTISASAGASFRVPIKKREAFIQIFQKRRLRRDRPKGENGGEINTDPALSQHGSTDTGSAVRNAAPKPPRKAFCTRDKARKD